MELWHTLAGYKKVSNRRVKSQQENKRSNYTKSVQSLRTEDRAPSSLWLTHLARMGDAMDWKRAMQNAVKVLG
jgi:hypothetical protein